MARAPSKPTSVASRALKRLRLSCIRSDLVFGENPRPPCLGHTISVLTSGRQGRPYPDPLVKVYDLRNLKALPPIPFSAGPSFITRLSNRPSTLAITSNQGLIQIVDTTNPNANEFYQLDAPSFISSVAVSPTAAYMAFGDSDGAIHLLSAADEEAMLPFNGFEGKPIDWADSPEPLPEITWTDGTYVCRVPPFIPG